MELTGKCLEEFKKWYIDIYLAMNGISESRRNLYINRFYSINTDSEKHGVYEDYFDSVGVVVNIYSGIYDHYNFYVCIDVRQEEKIHKSRPLARTAAITKADEIRNEQLNK